MNKFFCACARAFLILAIALTIGNHPTPSRAATPNVAILKPPASTESPRTIPTAAELGEQIQSIVSDVKAAADDQNQEQGADITPTYGTKALNVLVAVANVLSDHVRPFLDNIAAMPQLTAWLAQQRSDPKALARWEVVGDDLTRAVGAALIVMFALEFLLFPARLILRRRHPSAFSARAAAIGLLLILRAMPIIAFIGCSLLLLDMDNAQKLARFIVLNVVYAIALIRTVLAITRGLLAPRNPSLRLIPMATEQAILAQRWIAAFVIPMVSGYFCADIARTARVPETVIAASGDIFGLALTAMTAIAILRSRAFVAGLLRGSLPGAQEESSWFDQTRLWLARHWHRLAIAYLIVVYCVVVIGVADGFALMLRGTLLTLSILIGMRFAFRLSNQWGARDTAEESKMHHAILRLILRAAIGILAAIGIVASWGADVPTLFATPWGHRIMGSVLSIGTTIFALAFLYETINASIARALNARRADGKMKASARARTLLPMMRNGAFIVFAAIAGFVLLSEAGVNVGPLLAGAGILGVALGFGSQTLVKDFLTGLFIVAENTVTVGDFVRIGDHEGVIEGLSIRTLRLRDQFNDGALHILPFSEVSQVVNLSRGFTYALIDVGVSYDTDLQSAMETMRKVGDELQQDPVYGHMILDPIEIFGVQNFSASSIDLRARIRTRPRKHNDIRRHYLFLLKQAFDKENITIPFPTVLQIRKNATESPSPREEG
ncbi:MAG: mechanosensitive ion channel domain-containing protein [Bdellovibrionales bacterium]